jgi:hypothetical protein
VGEAVRLVEPIGQNMWKDRNDWFRLDACRNTYNVSLMAERVGVSRRALRTYIFYAKEQTAAEGGAERIDSAAGEGADEDDEEGPAVTRPRVAVPLCSEYERLTARVHELL